MDLYWDAVARLAWDIIHAEALAGGRFGEPEVKEWPELDLSEQIALIEFTRAVAKVLNG